ncbi:MAG TPA: hypothetical protein VEW94_06530 [Chloroflexia bacterium]|nr:hypothetical protein [Chloroflexia bacterium]
MDSLRKPFFFLALALIVIVVLIEIGAVGVLKGTTPSDAAIEAAVRENATSDPELLALDLPEREVEIRNRVEDAKQQQLVSPPRPGLGIPYMALLDGALLFTVGLLGAGLVVSRQTQGRTQGCVTLIFSLLLLLASVVMLFLAIALVLTMISLFVAVPFGTIAYIAGFGFFNRTASLATLGLLMLLKLGFAGSLVAAHQRFLQNKGLVLIVATSLLANIIVALLHGIVPGILVSITDGIAAIVVAILAIIWLIVLLIGSIGSVAKSVA